MSWYAYVYYDAREEKMLEPIYVGKGRGSRAYEHLSQDTNAHLNRKIRKMKDLGLEPHIQVIDGLTEDQAFMMERFFIKSFGRIDLGTGTLTNLTDGGEGVSGLKHTLKARAKMSEAKVGKVAHNKGKSLSDEQRMKISQSLTGKKPSTDTREKMSRTRTGKKMPPRSPEHAAKLAEAQRGKKASEETRRKMSETRKRLAQERKALKGMSNVLQIS